MRAVRIVLQTEIFVDLQQCLLMGDRPGEIASARIVAKQTRRRDFDSPIGQASR